MNDINSFEGMHRFLSNFWPCQIYWSGMLWSSTEHAYQSAKTNSLNERRMIQNAMSPNQAKKLGRKVTMRADWDQVKLTIMRQLLELKFAPGSQLAEKLIATGDAQLIEGNWWGDTYWGVCRGIGHNHLGKLLMEVRTELRKEHHA